MDRGSGESNGRVVIVLAVLLAVSGSAAPTALGATTSGVTSPNSPHLLPDQQEPGSNNTTVAHRNPSEVSENGSAADMQEWVSKEMIGRLSESANLSQSDRERARELVGNDSEYSDLVEQYAEATNRTNGSEGRTKSFAIAGQRQRQFFAAVGEYRRLHRTYQADRENDSDDLALRLAHRLERRLVAVNRSATRLNASYENISGAERASFRSAARSIGEIRGNVTRTQQAVRDQTLTRTELTVRATRSSGSFADPIPLEGRLRTAEGDPVADENVTLLVGNRTLNVTTGPDGRFEVEYRPTLAPVGDRPRTIAFRPTNDSVYLRDAATVRFGVEQVTPEVRVSNRTASVRYNETLVVNGSVAAGDAGVPSVPVAASVGGVRIASGRTGPNGSFGVAGRLPANVSNGSQSVRVRVVPANATRNASGSGTPGSGSLGASPLGSGASGPANDPDARLAVASAETSAEVTVAATPTRTSITTTRTVNGTAFVAGTLQTRGGAPVPNQTVALRIGGQTVGKAVTNETGGFATTVGIPDSVENDSDSSVSVAAVHSSAGGNLGSSSAQGTLTVGSAGGPVSGRLLRFGALGLLTVAVLGAVGWWARSSDDAPSDLDAVGGDETEEDEAVEGAEEGDGDSAVGEFDDVRHRAAGTLLDGANAALDAGNSDEAVVAAYGAVRRELAGDGIADPERPRTHWEFFAACREAGVGDEALGRLEDLTETYERAAFADGSVSVADAREAVRTAESFGAAA
ncbi:DUF4129 domain-containing protein [Halorussus ruber]|uniref:DUF4129 domain-containing protein n=1 Tax=Halorussus ruber TaxID=1126238 RepID=UPI0010931106|nr:DUF4129 domain-containing protein [Halorussus ruber]